MGLDNSGLRIVFKAKPYIIGVSFIKKTAVGTVHILPKIS